MFVCTIGRVQEYNLPNKLLRIRTIQNKSKFCLKFYKFMLILHSFISQHVFTMSSKYFLTNLT